MGEAIKELGKRDGKSWGEAWKSRGKGIEEHGERQYGIRALRRHGRA
jgi:hypothetical protein